MNVRQDRRVRRSREAMRSALVGLVLEKGFRAVTIEEVLDRADVARATFYAHYRDKDDLLVDVVRDSQAPLPVLRLFEHVDRHRAVYRVILRGEGDGRALREFVAILTARAEEQLREGAGPGIPLDIAAHAWAGELVGVLTWWVESGAAYSPAEITAHLRDPSPV